MYSSRPGNRAECHRIHWYGKYSGTYSGLGWQLIQIKRDNTERVKAFCAVSFCITESYKKITLFQKILLWYKGQSAVKIFGNNAFYKCTNLKTIVIKSKKLTSKNVSKNAFKGIGADTVIKVPKSKLNAYKKLFVQKGLSKDVKIKKI